MIETVTLFADVDKTVRSGSFHAWQILGAETRCRQSDL